MGVEGIVLAAGFSTRAGVYKMTLQMGGKTLIEWCIEGMYDICSRVIVVGGYKIENLKFLLDKYPKTELVLNEKYQDGMFSSVKKGISCIKEERFFLIPGDYPMINSSVYTSMLKVDGDIVVPMYKNQMGHPVLMKSKVAGELLYSTEYGNLREFISTKGFTPVEVNKPGILLDIDTFDDYTALLKAVGNGLYYNRRNKQRKNDEASIDI